MCQSGGRNCHLPLERPIRQGTHDGLYDPVVSHSAALCMKSRGSRFQKFQAGSGKVCVRPNPLAGSHYRKAVCHFEIGN